MQATLSANESFLDDLEMENLHAMVLSEAMQKVIRRRSRSFFCLNLFLSFLSLVQRPEKIWRRRAHWHIPKQIGVWHSVQVSNVLAWKWEETEILGGNFLRCSVFHFTISIESFRKTQIEQDLKHQTEEAAARARAEAKAEEMERMVKAVDADKRNIQLYNECLKSYFSSMQTSLNKLKTLSTTMQQLHDDAKSSSLTMVCSDLQ